MLLPTTLLAGTQSASIQTGNWRAWLDCEGRLLRFGLWIERASDEWNAWLLNGDERIRIPRVVVNGNDIVFDIEHFDAGLRGQIDPTGKRIDGEWWRHIRPDLTAHLPFHAESTALGNRGTIRPEASDGSQRFAGRWAVQFALRPDSSVADLRRAPDGTMRGTFINSTGDMRKLAGEVVGERLSLSRFDGAHAFLLEARLHPDGAMRGEFWEGNYVYDTWFARKNPDAQVTDPFARLTWQGKLDLRSLIFPDANGDMCSLADPKYAGKALVIEILGTWCPNCHDSTVYLSELHHEYAPRGLSVIGLAFEISGNFEHDVRQVQLYVESLQVPYPVLLATKGSSVAPSDIFPTITGEYAVPTILFVHGDGRLRAVHSGFTGPAAGEAYTKLRAEFEALVQELVSEP